MRVKIGEASTEVLERELIIPTTASQIFIPTSFYFKITPTIVSDEAALVAAINAANQATSFSMIQLQPTGANTKRFPSF